MAVAAPLGATVKSWPVPVRVTLCGLPDAPSVMVNIPVRLPPDVGVKVTVIWQLAATASDAPQVLVSAKSPEAEICVMFNTAVPVLLKVTLCDVLVVPATCALNVSADGLRLICGLSDIPDRLIVSVFPDTLPAIASVASRVPPAVGVKVTLTVHPFPGAKVLVQVLDWLKSPLFAPVIPMFATLTMALPVFVNATVFAVLVLPTVVDDKVRCVCDTSRKPPLTPVPVRGMTCGLLRVVSVNVREPSLAPAVTGTKVTLIVQTFPGRSFVRQLFVWL